MKKTYIRSILVTGLIITPLITMTGCYKSTPAVPVSKIEKNLKNDLDPNILKEAIINAAKEHNWKVVNKEDKSINLKKIYQKVRISPSKRGRWKNVEVDNHIYVDVNFDKHFFKVNLAKDSDKFLSSDKHIELFNKDLEKLENSIYIELVSSVL